MKYIGIILILLGIVGVIYFQTAFDTSVSVIYGGRVNNVGLMNDKLIYTIISLALILFGIILYVAEIFSSKFKGGYKENLNTSHSYNQKTYIEYNGKRIPVLKNESKLKDNIVVESTVKKSPTVLISQPNDIAAPLVCPKCKNIFAISYKNIEERKTICPKCSVTLIWGLPKQNECTRGII